MVGSSSSWAVRLSKLNLLHSTWIIKDPIGCLLTEFLARNYDIRPVILIRHPAAVVASVMRLGWKMDPSQVCDQPEMLEEYFPEGSSLFEYKGSFGIEGAAALWGILNTVILRQADRNPSWIVLTHEEICQRPLEMFRKLYSTLELRWSSRVEKRIRHYTGNQNPRAANVGAVHSFKRDSVGLLEHSLKLLSRRERQVIFDITRSVANQFYPEKTFALGD